MTGPGQGSGGSSPTWPAEGWPAQAYTGPPPTGPYGAVPPVAYGLPPWPGSDPAGPGAPVPRPPAPAGRPVTPPGVPPHDVPQPHALLMRTRDWAWWRPALGLLLFTVLYFVAGSVIIVLAWITAATPDLAMTDLTDPAVLLITNASLIVAIPIVWLCWSVPHGLRIGWSSSVLGRLRWRLFLPWTLRALVTLGLAVAATVLIPLATTSARVTGPDSSAVWLLLVVLLTTPLQSAAEEYVFRGYLSQAIAGWIGQRQAAPLVAAVVTAALFSAAHAPPDWPTFLYRFAMGLALSAVVWLTGGLEAAIVLHAVNNVVLFVLVGLLGDSAGTTGSSSVVDAVTMVLGLLGMVGYVAGIAAARSRVIPELVSPAVDLRRPEPQSAWLRPPVPASAYAAFPGPVPGWAGAGPGWGPAPAWPPPYGAPPPPDDRWARPAPDSPAPGVAHDPDQPERGGTAPAGGR